MKLVFVEDDEVDQLYLKRLFRDMSDCVPVFFNDGEEALAYLNNDWEGEPITVSSDVNMPNMDGVELLQKMRANPRLSKIAVYLFVVGWDDENIKIADACNCNGYFLKPLDLNALKEQLKINLGE